MLPGRTIVFDVGKTLAKLSLWSEDGRLIEQFHRHNVRAERGGQQGLDVEGIERWALEVLARFAMLGPVAAIVPVAHGAAAAVVRDGRLACPVSDYEDPVAHVLRAAYDASRDAFALTGSPALPHGLNLGVQLYRLQEEQPEVLTGEARIVPWPQYWAWRLSGVLASEVSSLGCHTDLWRPEAREPSGLARERGWAGRLAPLRRAEEVLGPLLPDWAARTGLSARVLIHCGAHDSNAALVGARGFARIAAREATVLSTGTWFVAMRTPAAEAALDITALPESQDCLINVDVDGRPIPSARFMGGRELELICGSDTVPATAAIEALPRVLATGLMALPSWVPDVGPYPHLQPAWRGEPRTTSERAVAAWLYAALMADACLELIGAEECVLVEGRFADAEVFVRALASLRLDLEVLVNEGQGGGVAYGSLRLVDPTLSAPGMLRRISPLQADLFAYKARWRQAVEARRCVA